ncbi:EamA family transporter [Pilimelia anulata]|uniref:EamA family transporter n=1 Tax=Pilimelia anulata TaxID=53371 RepID=UPI001E3C04F0|nr:EamA family transporter [Pilimelia anulata]
MTTPTATTGTGRAPGAGAVWAALATVYVVWGSTYLAIRVVVEDVPPFLSAGARFACAAGVLAVVLAARRAGALRVGGRELAACALVGVLLLVGGNGLVVLAETPAMGVPSGIAALLVAVVPLLVVVLRAATGDRPRAATVTGVLVGFGGLVLLVLPSGGGPAAPLGGALLVLVAAASWSTGSFAAGRLPLPADPFVATVYEMAFGGLGLLLLGLGTGEGVGFDPAAVSGRAWGALAYLTVAGSLLAFTAYVWLLHHAPLSLVATYAYVNPAVAVALGALLLAEPVGPRVLAGGAIIVLGVALVVSTERRRPRTPPPDDPPPP